jgi:hypothetical protein
MERGRKKERGREGQVKEHRLSDVFPFIASKLEELTSILS